MYPNASFLNNNNNELFNSLENCFDANSEFSHIIPVRESIKDSDRYQEIADNNNCLLLSPSLHKNLDKFQIYFDHNSGNCIFLKENKVIENCAIKKEWLNNERKKYLKLYEDTFLKK